MLARRGLAPLTEMARLTPGMEDGVAGLAFVEACLDSTARGGAAVCLPSPD